MWAGRSGRKIVPLCQGGQVSTQPPEESLVLALTSNSQGLSRLQVSCRQTKASAKEYGNSKQSKGYYKENGNFNKPCKRRKASLCAGSVLHAYICQEKNFFDMKVLWNTTQGRQLSNHFILSSLLMLQRKLSNKNQHLSIATFATRWVTSSQHKKLHFTSTRIYVKHHEQPYSLQ